MSSGKPVYIATRGSALALAQANFILNECRRHVPEREFALKIIKTTGDRMQNASLARIDATLPRGLFTKELEEALLAGDADLAVHSLKDLPTVLPDGLKLGATGRRADVRDVLIHKGPKLLTVRTLPAGAWIGTSSTRRVSQLQALRPDVRTTPIRGNVGTRLRKLSAQPELSGLVLAAAGLDRLGFSIDADGSLRGDDVPGGLKATKIELDEMLPCVGQGALGIEIRTADPDVEALCRRLNDAPTWHCVLAERSFLRAMGGGCQAAVAAYAEWSEQRLTLRAVSFLSGVPRQGEISGRPEEAEALGERLAGQLR